MSTRVQSRCTGPARSRLVTAVALAISSFAVAGVAPVAASDLGAWSGYALAQVLPDYEWVESDANSSAPSVFQSAVGGRSGFASAELIEAILPDLSFSLRTTRGVPGARGLDPLPSLLPTFGPGLERSLLAPSVTRSFGEDASLSLTALFARQHYASWGFGTGISSNGFAIEQSFAGGESSSGQGAAIAWRDGLTSELSYRVSYQSRIDMDPLQSVRGVYADAADFDMPAVSTVGFDWQFAPGWQLGIDASHVAYSDIRAFTSNTLPREFLSLLGDGGSPDFGWQDLTVYGAQLGFSPGPDSRWVLRWSTQQQPRPTSSLLDSVLSDRYSDVNWSFAFERRTATLGWWQFTASYSPVQYFLGAPSFADRDLDGRLLEVEAVWTVPF